jgi:NodT family efflux transporter outer membrane factor (OMF) lipoprotein
VNAAGRSGGKATGSQGQLSGIVVAASWELDLWGRVRYGRAAADAQYASSQADERAARQAIVAALAKAWFLASESMLQKRLITDVLQASRTFVRLADDRLQVGSAPRPTWCSPAPTCRATATTPCRSTSPSPNRGRALEVLLGRYPAAEIELPPELPPMPPPAATGVPSDLLERRPDIVAAERRFAASFARVEEARAAKLPRISLGASLSAISSSTFVLKTDSDPTLGGTASIFFPIFNGGQLEAQVELRTAEQKQAGAAFAQTAIKAFNEVETALASESTLAARERVLRQGLVDTQRALELEQVRFRVGSKDLRTVTQQQLAAYAASMSLIRVQTEQRVQRVQLHLALGGDFAPAGS